MTLHEKMHDVARVYRLHGEGCARARLVFHGWTIDKPELLEAMLDIVRELAKHPAPQPTQSLDIVPATHRVKEAA